jgi:8-oxo-dGTP pyrophosphatase MutT (NUDIX family)
MNDASEAPVARRHTVVRPRDAASLILLRGQGRDLEVLAGRRPLSQRFMPGVYVFPGGQIDLEDRTPWSVETGSEALAPRLLRCARAALRESWEEAGVLIGQRGAAPTPAAAGLRPIERAYREAGLAAAMDLLTYVGRAITPSHSRRRFNTRFFLAEGEHVVGEPMASEELEDVGWHPIGRGPLESFRDVTRFMLDEALKLRAGAAAAAPPLFYWAKNARRIGVCREGWRLS